MRDMKLTSAEESILKILWKKEKAFIKEIIEDISGKKPAYSTVSTIVRILEDKGFVSHESFGKSYRYYPLIKKEEYAKSVLTNLMDNYFGGSLKNIISFMSETNDLSVSELDEILADLRKNNED